MNKKQSIFLKLNSPVVFLTFLMAVITVAFIIFSPRASSLLLPAKRDVTFNNFLENSKKNGQINPQEFWKFREFYSPGYFKLMNQGLEKAEIETALQNIGIEPKKIDNYSSLFVSRHSISLDGLTKEDSLSSTVSINMFQNILFKNKNSVIFKNKNGETFIIFLLPVSEMKKANGFFDYEGKDKNLLENKNWFSLTKIDR